MKTSTIIFSAITAAVMASAHADSFIVATGDSKSGSTYSQMFRELMASCSKDMPMSEQETTGSTQNIQLLTENQVNAAFVQTDMLFFNRMTDPARVANIKTLVALHPEELHFIVANGSKLGSLSKIFDNKPALNTVADLRGRSVGAVGGSVLSARVFSEQSKLQFSVKEFSANNQLPQALTDGQVDAILVVGGSPHSLVKTLGAQFKLLSVPVEVQKSVSAVYTPAVIGYSNLNQAGVQTVSTSALLVTRTYKSKEVLSSLSKFRDCFVNTVPVIQDTRKTHPKWQVVDVENKGKWQWYDLTISK